MRRLILSAVVITALAGCRDGVGPNAGNTVGLGFQLARTSSASSVALAASTSGDGTPIVGAPPVVTPSAAGLQIARDSDVIVITKAQLVVRDVKLRSALATCDDDDTGASLLAVRQDDRSRHDDDDDCPMVRIGPFLVQLPVNGADGARVSVPVPAGTYSSVRLTLHKVTSNDSADAVFRQANPDFRDISVRLEGTYNGVPFVFVHDINARLTVPLTDPLVIGETGDDVTVSIDLGLWFVRPQGGLYGPALANTPGTVRAVVANNIRRAFRAFRDRNRDGHED
jgi:hypothetical protein